MIKVITSGLYSSLQDSGRFGFRNCGVPLCGAMDLLSMATANLLVGNEKEATVLEFTAKGPVLEFTEAAVIAISGADFSPMIDGKKMGMNVVFAISKGSILSFGIPSKGIRGYMAIKGGFMAEKVLGSRSFYKGVTSQSQLYKGDTLQFYKDSENSIELDSLNQMTNSTFDHEIMEVFKGPEFEFLSPQIQNKLVNTSFSIDSQSNRMAYLLDHSESLSAKQIITAPVQPGTVQLTPGGKTIVLMRDAQTTGGYARVFQLTKKAINQLAQKRAGETIYFKIVDPLLGTPA